MVSSQQCPSLVCTLWRSLAAHADYWVEDWCLLPSGEDKLNCFLLFIITTQEQMSQAVKRELSSAGPGNGEVWYRSVVWAWPAPRTCASCVLHIWIEVHIPQKAPLGDQGCSQPQALLVLISMYQKWCGRRITAFHAWFCHGDSANR